MKSLEKAVEEIRRVSEERQAQRDAEKAFDARVERVAMRLLGKQADPSPGVNWFCNRAWTVNEVRALVRSALEAEEARL
jgi:hypothetical protein